MDWEALGACWDEKEKPSLERCDWFSTNTFHHRQFADLDKLVAAKEGKGMRVSVCLPSLNVESTIAQIVRTVRLELMDKVQLVDELVVVDGDSSDRTVEVAAAEGAKVFRQGEILPHIGSPQGKGDALWRSLYCTTGDIVIWVDSDIRNFHPRFVYGILGPLLLVNNIRYVKGFYQRPLAGESKLFRAGGGRVTELVARPMLSLFYPELGSLIQPLAGEYGGYREILEKVPFFTRYGVEIGLNVDIYTRFGMEVIGQVDLEEREHFNQPLSALGKMAFEIIQALLRRLEEQGKLKLLAETSPEFIQVDYLEGQYQLEKVDLKVEERPPMVEVEEYRRARGLPGR
ncbi:MAG: glucosyl-3-phosphoglycerate synthase [Candidatus Geothermincolales bacterium]